MTLIKCKECGHEVSKKAKECPNCGAPQGEKQYGCGSLVLVLMVIFVGLYTIGTAQVNKVGSTSKNRGDSARLAAKRVKSPAEAKKDYIEKLEDELKGLEGYNFKPFLKSKDTILLGLDLIEAWPIIVEEGGKHNLDENELKLLERFKKKSVVVQSKFFPKLRDAYGPAVRKILWKDDVTAKTFGAGFRIIEFVGGIFAANRNKQEFQNAASDILYKLRFNQARYKWYKFESEYTYYKLDPFKDTDLVVWSGNNGYIVN